MLPELLVYVMEMNPQNTLRPVYHKTLFAAYVKMKRLIYKKKR